jgi:ribonuclease P protein subunit POP4
LPRQIGIQSSIDRNSDNNSTAKNSSYNQNVANAKSEAYEAASGVVSFLIEHLPRSDHKEIEDELKKTFPLHNQKGGKIKKPQPKRKGKYLTAHERRKLGLNRLPKSGGLKCSEFFELNQIWEDYMRDLLGWKCPDQTVTKSTPKPSHENKKKNKINGEMLNIGDEQFRMRICRADFHGALVKITKSRAASQLGVQGYVAMETRNTLQLLTKEDSIKIIPKSGTSFSFCLDNHLFTVGGSNFCIKPSERAVKKWKNRPPYDL